MKLLEEKLTPYSFVRVHKSFIVAIDKVSAVQKTLLSIGNNEIPVSDSYREALMEVIRNRNIL